MVLCIVAFIVFSILGLFSAYYRKLAKEAFICVINMLTFQPCKTKLDERIKSKVTIKLMHKPVLARFFYRNFKLLSWVFTLTFFASLIYSSYGIYNLIVYGSCQPSGTCELSPGRNQIVEIMERISCYETQIVYAVIIIVFASLLFIFYKHLKKKYLR